MKREVPLLLTFLFGTFFILSNFIIWERWRAAAESVNNWVLIVIAFTYVLGVGNIFRIHGLKISRQQPGWGYSLATILGLVVMLFFGIVLWFLPQTEGRTTVRFRVLKSVDLGETINVSSPMGSGDLFDLSTHSKFTKDANGNGKADEGDEIETTIEYAYSGSQVWPSAIVGITYDRTALVPIGGAGEPPVGSVPPAAADAAADKTGAAPPTIPAGEIAPVPPGISAKADGLVWNAGRVEPSLFGRTYAGDGQASLYTWFYDSIYTPMQSTMFALLAFFISSAAFRAFRLRSAQAVLLGVTALVVILGSVPVGEALWGKFPDFVAWIMDCLQTAGKRAILIGAALGAIATGLKMIVGAEKGYLARD